MNLKDWLLINEQKQTKREKEDNSGEYSSTTSWKSKNNGFSGLRELEINSR